MQRYFFDVNTRSHIQYDYKGRDFCDFEQARSFAELIALDVECIDSEELGALEVQVRDLTGRHLFSVPVRAPDLVAA